MKSNTICKIAILSKAIVLSNFNGMSNGSTVEMTDVNIDDAVQVLDHSINHMTQTPNVNQTKWLTIAGPDNSRAHFPSLISKIRGLTSWQKLKVLSPVLSKFDLAT